MVKYNEIFVSVIMPVYNGSIYLEEAIISILNQTHRNFEFIIVDNQSTDQSYNLVLKYAQKDTRIKIFQETKKGVAYALNNALITATGDFIFRMDCDDLSTLDRFENTIKYMINNDLDVCGSFINKFGKTNSQIYYPIDDLAIRFAMNYCSPFAHPSICFNSRIKEHIIYEDKIAEDLILWRKLALIDNIHFGNIPLSLLKYRTHNSQVTNSNSYTILTEIDSIIIESNIDKIAKHNISLKDKIFIIRNYLGKIHINIIKKVYLLNVMMLKHLLLK